MLMCELCGTTEGLKVGGDAIFSEYNVICKTCLGKCYKEEFSNPLDVAECELEKLNVCNDDIYGFYVDDNKVMVDYFNQERKLTSRCLVTCSNSNEACDVLCELC